MHVLVYCTDGILFVAHVDAASIVVDETRDTRHQLLEDGKEMRAFCYWLLDPTLIITAQLPPILHFQAKFLHEPR